LKPGSYNKPAGCNTSGGTEALKKKEKKKKEKRQKT
jgi:hypothetical protein